MKTIAFALLTGIICHQSCHAISMLHTLNWAALDNNNPYIVEGANWESVGFIHWTSTTGPSFVGTGTLVPSSIPGEFKILTAAHNVDSEGGLGGTPDGIIDADNFNIFFGANTGANGGTATGSVIVPRANIAVHPFWTDGNGAGLTKGAAQYDLAVMTFTITNVTSGVLPTTLQISTDNPTGLIGTMIGYGSWGSGQTFGNSSPDGYRRAGQNVIDVVGTTAEDPANQGFTVQTDFDGPSGEGHTTGTASPLTLEASTGGGDSGGPLVAGGGIVGVLNGGFSGIPNGKLSEYGDRSVWAALSDQSNINFLISAGVVIPEPSSLALVGLGMAGMLFRRRRVA